MVVAGGKVVCVPADVGVEAVQLGEITLGTLSISVTMLQCYVFQ